MDRTRVLALGGCLLHGPVNHLARTRRDFFRVRLNLSQSLPVAYTFGEMLQQIALFRGEITVPSELVPLLGLSPDASLEPETSRLDDVDLVLVEPNSPAEILFEGYYLHRGAVVDTMTALIGKARRSDDADLRRVEKTVSGWLSRGVLSFDPASQAKRTEALEALIPAGMQVPGMVRALIDGIRGVQRDPAEGLSAVARAVRQPVALVTFTFQYMPDGRAVGWPPNFCEHSVAAALDLGLPVFEPWRVVQEHGVAAAMRPDLRHYREEFIPVVAKPLADFIGDVLGSPAAERRCA